MADLETAVSKKGRWKNAEKRFPDRGTWQQDGGGGRGKKGVSGILRDRPLGISGIPANPLVRLLKASVDWWVSFRFLIQFTYRYPPIRDSPSWQRASTITPVHRYRITVSTVPLEMDDVGRSPHPTSDAFVMIGVVLLGSRLLIRRVSSCPRRTADRASKRKPASRTNARSR